ncbi:hypothetical protein K2173_014697 [Erythroxylum novogranatense]|uniref:Uncharacterized protein n=1 Tax=Erythroxylum novogranatense TaxID=1862640 RepID=A0AAV8TH32_9ROSI|nr:hypothetical protein K2173_014697 [Erythroxylum novogranatense]
MERICEELDEAKLEIERLKAHLKGKVDLSENLRKACNEQLIKLEEATSKIDKQSQELNEKEEEIFVLKQKCEDVQFKLNDKEATIRRLSTATDKLRVDCEENCRKWEEGKRGLVLALDDANEKSIDQEQKINVLMAENEGLKGLLSASQKKCSEAEKKARAPKELRERDDLLLKLEEESRKVEDKLKWKKEQFKHLEEAHEKLREQFRQSKKEWEREKSTLIDEVCSLQTSLDSQTRISEDLSNRLEMCNQALAHEETRRKYLEAEVSEFKARFENVLTECEQAKSQIECLTAQRDKEIAALRHALATKETFYRENEYRVGKLEQENQELLASIRELQETRIQEVGSSSSVAKLRNKLKRVEQMHRDCSANLKAKDAEWSSQLEKLTVELNQYRSKLELKEEEMERLKMEVENCHFEIVQLKLQNEEASVMSLVLKSGIAESHLNLREVETKKSVSDKEKDESISLLMKQLEMKNIALAKAQTCADDERHKAASLLKRIESLILIEEQQILLQKELERYRDMVKESSSYQVRFKEQSLQTETDLKDKLQAACDALDMANSELAKEREKVISLSGRIESLSSIEEKQLMMQGELESCRKMIEESSKHQLYLEERALQIENESKEKLREVCDALTLANSELSQQHEKSSSLSKRVESLDMIEEQRLLLQKELHNYKKMLEESSKNQLLVQKKALQTETELKEKLKKACDALETAKSELAKERETAASYLSRVENSSIIEQEQLEMQKELDMCREMLEESYKCQVRLEEEALLRENNSKREIQELHKALDNLNSDLAAKVCAEHAFEFELWIWKSIAERFKDDLEESQSLRKELEASLIAQVEVGETFKLERDNLSRMLETQDIGIDNLQRHVSLYEEELKTRESEKESFLQMMIEKDKSLEHLQKEIEWLEQESFRREIEGLISFQTGAERTFELEKEKLIQLIEKRDQRIDELLQLQLTGEQAQISLLQENLEKIVAAEILTQLEIEEKKLMIKELEGDVHSLQQKLELQGRSLSQSEQKALQIETELVAKQIEMKNLINVMEAKMRSSEALVDELEAEKASLVGDVRKLSSENENLLGFVAGIGDRISQITEEDTQLMGILEKIVHSPGNMNPYNMSSSTKNVQAISKERSPFRELN